ncbi:NAD(P)-dependent oxidoreductase [Paenibacillus sp. MDMC362]|nr:NAD(P)-dependent oxidoreductase [Paenibacillus sp. MDMC362]
MNIEAPNDSILQKDIDRIAQELVKFPEINHKTIFVTGASGLLGSLTVKSLLCLNRCYRFKVSVVALVRSLEKAQAAFGDLMHDDKLRIIVGDIGEIPDIVEPIDYIIHGASVTSSRDFVEHPVETIFTAINGTNQVLELARSKNISGMVYISSLEMYGTINSDIPVSEDAGGYIDPLSIRSSYSESKRMAENLCCAFSSEYGLPVKIARLTQTFGPGVSYNDNRVFAQFARSVIKKKNIVLHTKGSTVRNYCYTSDAIRALFYILLKGTTGSAYNVANMGTGISIRDMAELAAKFGSHTNIVFERGDNEKRGYNPPVTICLDTSRLQALGWSAEVGLEEMFQNLIKSMESSLI